MVKIGNSYGIIIDKAIIEMLGITPNTQFEMSMKESSEIVFKIAKDVKTV